MNVVKIGLLALGGLLFTAPLVYGGEANPAWSPDGLTIAFQTSQDGDDEIYFIDLVNGEVFPGTENPFEDRWPVYAPEGKSLYFATGATVDDFVIARFRLDTFRNEVLTGPGVYGGLTSPSADGQRLLFYGPSEGNWDVRMLDLATYKITSLTSDPAFDGVASWAPDGRILFQSDRDGDSELYLMNPDGTGLQQVTSNDFDDAVGSYSPDGRKILFETNRNGNFDLYVLDLETGAETRLTTDPADDVLGRWSPDGSTIAFETKRDGEITIYLMNADGSDQRPLFKD